MLLRALKKVQTTEDAEKLCAACGQAFFCGKCFAKDGAPPELDVLRVLGGHDVVGHHEHLQSEVDELRRQRLDQRRFAGADRSADADP